MSMRHELYVCIGLLESSSDFHGNYREFEGISAKKVFLVPLGRLSLYTNHFLDSRLDPGQASCIEDHTERNLSVLRGILGQ